MDLKNQKPGTFLNRIKFRNPSQENLEPCHCFSSGTKFWNSTQRQAPRQAMTYLPTHKRHWIKEYANASHAIIVKEVADALTLQCYRRQEFKKISDAPSLPLSRMSHHQIEGDCWRTNIAVLPQLLRRCWGGCCAVLQLQSCHDCQEFEEIADAPPSSSSRRSHHQIKGDCWRANIAVSPPLLRRFPHCSLAGIKNLRRTKDMWEE